MDSIAQIERRMQALGEEAERVARETGFVKRCRVMTAGGFVGMLTWGSTASPELTLTALSQASYVIGVGLTPQGIAQRFTPEAAEFMRRMLEQAVSHAIEESKPALISLLDRFSGVYLLDSSVISLPQELQESWPGVGGSAGPTATVKLQVRLEYRTGALDGPVLQPGRAHDRSTPFTSGDEPAGSLRICDLGYFSLDEIATRRAAGQYTLTRYKKGTALYTADGKRLSLLKWLKQLRDVQADIPVEVGVEQRVRMRLLVQRVPPGVVVRRRKRLREYARKKQVQITAETWELAAWTLVLVDVPQERLNLDEALALLGVRWQVELLFKRWKSQLRIDEWRSRKPYRILCELYGKLIAAVLQHWIFQVCWWHDPGRSLVKATQLIQKFALNLARAIYQRSGVEEILCLIVDGIRATCHLNKRRKHPATFQTLLAPPTEP